MTRARPRTSYPAASTVGQASGSVSGEAPRSVLDWWLVAVVALVLARSAVFFYYPYSDFDADQAIIGLQAKHLAEGRALPVFAYGMNYVLAIESWLAAPLFAMFGASATALKAVPAAFNVATGALLYWLLVTRGELSRPAAFVATLPFALTGPVPTGDLTNALGMNIEPLFFTLVLWWARDRPVLQGAAAALGILNREFVVYAVFALVCVEFLQAGRQVPWRRAGLALLSFAGTWLAIAALKRVSTPDGPGTSFNVLFSGSSNVDVAARFVCFELEAIPHDVGAIARTYLPMLLGVGPARLSEAGINSTLVQGVTWAWPALGVILVAAALYALVRSIRRGANSGTWLGLYLLLVGAQSVFVYAATRCGHLGIMTNRYMLLGLFAPVGVLVLTFSSDPPRLVRRVLSAVVVVWAGLCAIDGARLFREYQVARPRFEHQELARYLVFRGVRYIKTDYWTGYYLAFISNERIIPLTNYQRIEAYTHEVEANDARAIEIRRVRDARCEGAVEIADWYVCPPPN